MNNNFYYSSNELFSHNAFINFVMGVRGGGKSFDAKDRAIRNFLKNKKQTVYIRRTRTEIDLVKKTYFNDIMFKYPDTEFSVNGDVGYINGEIAIIFLPLSVSSNFKSSSYPEVNFIVFDEYVIAESVNKRYLKNEMILLLELIETIFRMREGRVLFLGNAISYVNPLFNFFDIEINDTNKRFHKFKNGLIVIELANNSDYIEEKSKTKFYNLLEGTNYLQYAFNNVALEDDFSFICKKRPRGLDFLCTLRFNKNIFSVWLTQDTKLYIDDVILPNTNKKYGITPDDICEGYTNYKNDLCQQYCKYLKQYFFNNDLLFKNITIKKEFIKLLGRI